MAKNLIPEIARMLGVEIGEKFKIKGDGHTYSIELDGLHSDQYAMEDDYAILLDLLCGEAEIVKLPWKPYKGERYWTIHCSLLNDVWMVIQYTWDDSPIDFELYKVGWVYRSEKEAQAALPSVAKELGVEYKL